MPPRSGEAFGSAVLNRPSDQAPKAPGRKGRQCKKNQDRNLKRKKVMTRGVNDPIMDEIDAPQEHRQGSSQATEEPPPARLGQSENCAQHEHSRQRRHKTKIGKRAREPRDKRMPVARVDHGSGSQMRRQYHTTKPGDSSKDAPPANQRPSRGGFLRLLMRIDCIHCIQPHPRKGKPLAGCPIQGRLLALSGFFAGCPIQGLLLALSGVVHVSQRFAANPRSSTWPAGLADGQAWRGFQTRVPGRAPSPADRRWLPARRTAGSCSPAGSRECG
jgi:hypothetical protein